MSPWHHDIKAGDVLESLKRPHRKYDITIVYSNGHLGGLVEAEFHDSKERRYFVVSRKGFLLHDWRKLSPDEAEVWRVMGS